MLVDKFREIEKG
jgi:hypothetical protein